MFKNRIITLMFHRVNDASLKFSPHQFEHYLEKLVDTYPFVLPGDPLPKNKTALCLTFDDGYYDFYQDVFPLLNKFQIPAILAVSTKYIVDNAKQPPAVRLSVPYAHDMENPFYQAQEPFCSWQELQVMTESPYVEIASHGYQHANLSHDGVNLVEEVVYSKKTLEQRLNRTIRFFVYPFGAISLRAHALVKQHYEFGIRIGSALNFNWDRKNKYVYRINADPLWTQNKPISQYLIAKLTLKYSLNRLRKK